MVIFLFFWSNHGLTRRSHVDLADTILDRRRALNAPAYRQLAPFGKTVGIPLLLLGGTMAVAGTAWFKRSEEHTSELQSPVHLVCRLLLEKKKNQKNKKK